MGLGVMGSCLKTAMLGVDEHRCGPRKLVLDLSRGVADRFHKGRAFLLGDAGPHP